MSGEFFTIDNSKDHKCKPPYNLSYAGVSGEPRAAEGARWRCECGKAYLCIQETERGETWKQWKRTSEHDKK